MSKKLKAAPMDLDQQIRQHAQTYRGPRGKTLSTLTLADGEKIAAALNLPRIKVELAALDLGIWPRRYLRNVGSLGIEGQKKLLQSKVLVVGAGGLGGTVAQLLARIGVGSLVLGDGDSFTEENLNRQAFSFESNLGQSKVQAARSEISRVNGSTEVQIFEGLVGEKDLFHLTQGANLAIDALDNLPTRFLLEKACRHAGIPMIHGAVAGFQGQILVVYPDDPGLQTIYGDPRSMPERGVELELGNLPGIVSAIASLQVQEAVKILTGLGQPFRHRLFFLDSLEGSVQIIYLK
jgi:molybdopterin/thiamine biosynthesis adenylyltransferase